MQFKLLVLVGFILFEPFLPVKAFFWSNFSYRFFIWILLVSMFDLSRRNMGEKLALGGIICAVFFRPSICGLTFPWSNVFYLLLICGAFLISLLGKESLFWKRTKLDIPIILFLVLSTGYMFLSLERVSGARQVVSLWGAGIFYFLMIREINTPDAIKIILVFLLGSLSIMANGLYQLLVGLEETRVWIETYTQGELGMRLLDRLSCGRIFSNFIYPNAYAGFLIMLIPVVFSMLWTIKGYKKIGVGALLGFSLFSLYTTYSKGGWLSLALTSITAFIFLFPGIGNFKKVGILLITFILLFSLVMSLESTGSKKLGFIKSFKVRWEYWHAALLMIKDRPFRGYGIGNFGEFYARYKLPMAEETQMAHNNYLQVWMEMGLGGILIFLWLISVFLRIGIFSGDSLSRGAFWGSVAFLIHSFVDFDFYVPNLLFSAFFWIGTTILLSGRFHEYILLRNLRPKPVYYTLGIVVFLGILHSQLNYVNLLLGWERVKSFISSGKFNVAEIEIDRLLRIAEFNPRFHFEKGRLSEVKALGQKKKSAFTEAVYEYSMASALNPYRAGYHFTLGRLYWKLRHEPRFLKKSISEFRRAHEMYPTKEEYKNVLIGLKKYER